VLGVAAADERSPMTLLGRAVMALPMDVRLCRVVFYGVLLGVPCDAAVMAATLAAQVYSALSLI
jgi:HrpA-like RNA helicase